MTEILMKILAEYPNSNSFFMLSNRLPANYVLYCKQKG
jgi:hypothetical protein